MRIWSNIGSARVPSLPVSIPDLRGTFGSSHLDLMRGLAAIAVLLSHLRNIFFVDYAQLSPQRKGWFMALIYFMTDLGHQAVIIFFILSGFLIAGSVMKSGFDKQWSWRQYLINRGSRLYAVLIPALLLGLVLDRTGMALGSAGIYAGQLHDHVIEFPVAQRGNWSTLIGNALFLQEIVVKPFGSNAALWSLSYEFWYYIIFPLLFFAIISKNVAIRWTSAGGALLAFLLVGKTISLYFLIWLTGAAINIFPPRMEGKGTYAPIIAVAAFLLTLASSRIPALASAPFAVDFILGLATSALIHAVLGDDRQINSKSPYARIVAAMSGLSYTLYLVHLPLLVLISSRSDQTHRWQPNATAVAGGLSICAAALIYAGTVAYFTERRTDGLRRRLTRLVEPLADVKPRAGRQTTNQSVR